MLNMNRKLAKRQEEGQIIKTGIVGAGHMGKGLVMHMYALKGIMPAIVADTDLKKVLDAYKRAGIPEDFVAVANTLAEANSFMEKGKFVACEDAEFVSKSNITDCVIDATGVPDVGAKVAVDSITNKKHVVMLNVETDVVISPYLCKLARENGVLYTGSGGDEPGAVMELYDFATALGMEVVAMGKGKNNAVDRQCTPDSVLEEATKRKMSPRMLCAFKDGSKTMVELTAMSNATGLVPDVVGCRGIKSDVKGLNELFKLKSEGGILNRKGIVEYVDGIAPGVFVTVTSDNEEIKFEMDYLKVGPGPLWTLYRPYHLCNLETPLTVAKLVIDNETTIVPKKGLVSECITVAKKDLKAGEFVDGIGGYTTYGSIATKEESDKNNYVPYGLVNKNAKMLKDAKKGQIITKDMIELDESSFIFKIRSEQNQMQI